MLDMMSMLTLLNPGKKEEEEEVTTLKHLGAGSKVGTFEGKVGTFEVKERDGVLIVGIEAVAFLALILVVVAGYFFRKMVNWCKEKRRKQTVDKINHPSVMERV